MSYKTPAQRLLTPKKHRARFRRALWSIFFLATTTAIFAGPPSSTSETIDTKGITTDQPRLRIDEDVTLDYTYVGDADLKSGSGGHLGEQTTLFGYSAKVPLNDQYSLQFGLGYNRLDFSQPTGSPLPYNLQTLSVSIGGSYKISDQWGVFAMVSPRLEMIDGWDNIESQDFAVSGAIGSTYKPNKDLSLRFGLMIDPDSALGTPVMPLLGLRWQFAQAWNLNFGFPRTSIDYQLLPNLRFSPIELGFEGGSFRTSSTYGNSVGASQLNDRKLDYREIRAGASADYALQKNVDITLNAGEVVYRDFDFKNSNTSLEVKPAPFVQLGVKVGF